ncbi:MAG: GGDEF domain-containing protein [Clostridiales bacterium]|nr:GGDEF domain-containing protein [Clostridiales bacterium]
MSTILDSIREIFQRNRVLKEHIGTSKLKSRIILQSIISLSFLLLTFANIYAHSYIMLLFTGMGCVINGLSAVISWKYRSNNLCVYSTTLTCCLMFAFFVIYGGNDGFACLWIILFPFLAIIVVDFIVGFATCLILQIYLIVIFWTPASSFLMYPYNEQFQLRFPLLFLVTLILAMTLAISLQKSQYNEHMHLLELERMTEAAENMARHDLLTKLANRRYAYENFGILFSDDSKPHCIVMGDIDSFKRINDLYGHEFGDEVLVGVSQRIIGVLPDDYLKSRWGGEEFLIAANDSIETVYEQIEKLRKTIESLEFSRDGEIVKVTVTFGIAEYYKSSELNSAINIADTRLYAGKKTTKNCTVVR